MMCKATEYASQLIQILNEVEENRNHLREKLSDLELAEQDLLHKAENEELNIIQGYDIYKGIHDIRNTRRVLKNELKGLEELVKTTNGLRPTVIKVKDRISDEYVKLCVNMNTRKYNPRKLNIHNDIRIEVKTIIGGV